MKEIRTINMNKYIKEFREMIFRFQSTFPKHGKVLYINMSELEEILVFIKTVCETAQMYDDLCK